MRIYVAGPLVASNVAADQLRAVGHSPHVPAYHRSLLPTSEWEHHDLPQLKASDAVLRVPGEAAKADREVAEAFHLGKPVFHAVGDVREGPRALEPAPERTRKAGGVLVPEPPAPSVALNNDQLVAMVVLNTGANVFITGTAGTGKTVVVREWLKTQPRDSVAVTASTGIAAINLGGGTTIHRWSGAGICNKPMHVITDRGSPWWGKVKAIRAARALVLEEVSMVSGDNLTYIEELCRIARRADAPFGGLQVIFIGDFGQLPPVTVGTEGFAFESPAWRRAAPIPIRLTQVMRQTDSQFVEVLQSLRGGLPSPEALLALKWRERAFDPDARGALRIATHKAQVEKLNLSKLAALPGTEMRYVAEDTDGAHLNTDEDPSLGTGNPLPSDSPLARLLESGCNSPRELVLKPGARVIFTANEAHGAYVNGTLGTVEALRQHVITVKKDSGQTLELDRWQFTIEEPGPDGKPKVVACRSQFPLRLAWALVVHRVQGLTVPLVSLNLRRVFCPGQAYVALSRCPTLAGINIEDTRGPGAFMIHPKVLAYERSWGL